MNNMDEMRDMKWVRQALDVAAWLEYRHDESENNTVAKLIKIPGGAYTDVFVPLKMPHWYTLEHVSTRTMTDRHKVEWTQVTTRNAVIRESEDGAHIAQITHAMQTIAPLEDWKAITRDK